MSDASIHLTKFDAAERQLHQAITLFFSGGDPVSIHTLAEAAAQILYDLKDVHGGESMIRDNERIRPERKKEWLQYVFKARNFFKHADRDKNEMLEFKQSFNHYSLLDAVCLYQSAKKAWAPESLMYLCWFTLTYPAVLKADTSMARLVENQLNRPDGLDPTDLASFEQALRELRQGTIQIPRLELQLGVLA